MNEAVKAGLRPKNRSKKLLLIVVAFLLLGAAGIILAGDAVDDCKLYELEVGGSAFEYSCPLWCRQRVKQESSQVLASFSEAKTCQNYSPPFLIGFRDSRYLERRARIHACLDSGGRIVGQDAPCACPDYMPVDRQGACLKTFTGNYKQQLRTEGKCTFMKDSSDDLACGASSYCLQDENSPRTGTCQEFPPGVQARLGGSHLSRLSSSNLSRVEFESHVSMDDVRGIMSDVSSKTWQAGAAVADAGIVIDRVFLSLQEIMLLATNGDVRLISPAN